MIKDYAPVRKHGILHCDLSCLHATWPEDQALDGSGSCRTFQAIYCTKRKRPVYKNAPCAEKEKRTSAKSNQGRNRNQQDTKE